ncbi:hypothetical protein [Halomarina ordinaria]|uniref:Uncharacterized protein n=1 Tax=Halomarina ordinaria TaxID=3033939 RepID=A0ABD5U876_9EURY|nr:hypothetical protein [Halomarina sp. PSRA2]
MSTNRHDADGEVEVLQLPNARIKLTSGYSAWVASDTWYDLSATR